MIVPFVGSGFGKREVDATSTALLTDMLDLIGDRKPRHYPSLKKEPRWGEGVGNFSETSNSKFEQLRCLIKL